MIHLFGDYCEEGSVWLRHGRFVLTSYATYKRAKRLYHKERQYIVSSVTTIFEKSTVPETIQAYIKEAFGQCVKNETAKRCVRC